MCIAPVNTRQCSASASHLPRQHGCYNAVGLWFLQGIAGIAVDFSDGAYPLTIRAGVDTGDLSWASGSRAVPQGMVRSSWAIGALFMHNVTVPGNAAARVLIPATSVADVREGGQPLSHDIEVLGAKAINGVNYIELGVAAGEYAFSSGWVRHATSGWA